MINHSQLREEILRYFQMTRIYFDGKINGNIVNVQQINMLEKNVIDAISSLESQHQEEMKKAERIVLFDLLEIANVHELEELRYSVEKYAKNQGIKL